MSSCGSRFRGPQRNSNCQRYTTFIMGTSGNSEELNNLIAMELDSLSCKRKNDIRSPDCENNLQNKRYIFDTNNLVKENRYFIPPGSQISGENEAATTSQTEQKQRKGKVPPIYLHNANNYKNIVEDIIKIIENDKFTTHCKTNSVRINLEDSTDFRKLTKFYDENSIEYHTFRNPDDNLLQVVIRNLPISITEKEIGDELSKDFTIKKVVRLLNREKNPIPICAVDLENNANASKIYNLEKFMHAIVTVEQRRKPKDIPQCTRCQRYGHTKNYCKLEPRCVKCTGKHLYSECKKRPNEMPTCTNCGENHSANYKGCKYYTDLKRKLNSNARRQTVTTSDNNNRQSFPIRPNNSTQTQNHPTSYAEATRNGRRHYTAQPNIGNSRDASDMSTIFDTVLQFIQPYLEQIKQFICTLFTSMFNNSFQQK